MILLIGLQLQPMCATSFPPASYMITSNFIVLSKVIVLPLLIDHFRTEVPQFEVLLQPVPVGHHLLWVSEWGIRSVLLWFPILTVLLQLL